MRAGGALVAAAPSSGAVELRLGDRRATLHPVWLRNRSTEIGQIEATNRQRLFTPIDIDVNLAVTHLTVTADSVTADSVDGNTATSTATLTATFSDGHTASFSVVGLARALGWIDDPEAPPAPESWTAPLDPFPYVDWQEVQTDSGLVDCLDSFYRYGYVVIRNTPVELFTVREVCDRFGYISGNNFGWVFDVRAEQRPTDLAYTPIGLLAHTDQPYRQPVPGIQLLHCLINDAPGGDSTLVDGLAAADQLATLDPAAHAALCTIETEFRYDMGTDTVVGVDTILRYDRQSNHSNHSEQRFRQIRLNTKLDAPLPTTTGDLDAYYRGRRWLCEWLNDPQHQVTFRLQAGDVMFMDNLRVLHGRTAFDPSNGARHLQGAYIDHDGPDSRYRLATRRLAASGV